MKTSHNITRCEYARKKDKIEYKDTYHALLFQITDNRRYQSKGGKLVFRSQQVARISKNYAPYVVPGLDEPALLELSRHHFPPCTTIHTLGSTLQFIPGSGYKIQSEAT